MLDVHKLLESVSKYLRPQIAFIIITIIALLGAGIAASNEIVILLQGSTFPGQTVDVRLDSIRAAS
jgi:hypothetical protein